MKASADNEGLERIESLINQQKLLLTSRKRRFHKINGNSSVRKRRTKITSSPRDEQVVCESVDKEVQNIPEDQEKSKVMLKQKRKRGQSKRKQSPTGKDIIAAPSTQADPIIAAVNDSGEPFVILNSYPETEKREQAENEIKKRMVFTISQHKL